MGLPDEATKRLLIDGKLVESGRTFPSLNPATGSPMSSPPLQWKLHSPALLSNNLHRENVMPEP